MSMQEVMRQGLYDPRNEHDSCGVGFVVNIKGRKSHDIIAQGLKILENLDHRGAVGADPLVGDGAGCLIQMPDALLNDWARVHGKSLPAAGRYAVAMCFLPRDPLAREYAIQHFEQVVAKEGQSMVGWRDVPDGPDRPRQDRHRDHAGHPPGDRRLQPCRSATRMRSSARSWRSASKSSTTSAPWEKRRISPALTELYMPSFSTRTVVYKGLLLATQVGNFYHDLRNPLTTSALALVHQRFSTNTFPSWKLAHPYRFLAHNGEINTVRGNVNWMYARRRSMESDLIGPDLNKMWPIIPHGQSDTACIDNALELLVAGGYSLAHGDDDADPGGLGARPADGPGTQGLLRILRRADGAVGRPGRHRLHRRPPDRRHARPQRPAPGALRHHRRRLRHHGLGIRRAAGAGGKDRPQMAPAARQDAADRPRRRPHHRRRRDQAEARRASIPTPSG